ncbi:spindle and kinetochore-associated protein 1 isoform X2 [Antennarius striatus]|uniref:spindle and kinetochore-associated protein 1 isoform X2 n=1 Tax=Antennarius striatus TaxID=241820 RepID=UPI0035ADB541
MMSRNMGELETITNHIHDRISSMQRTLDLSVAELPQDKIKKLGHELSDLERLVGAFEDCVEQQKEQLRHLKELEKTFQKNLEDVQHLKNNIPAHMPRTTGPPIGCVPAVVTQKDAAGLQTVQVENISKSKKNFVREMEFITMPEFESIPQYMRGRVSYDQLNATVQGINVAVKAKYKILHQSVKTLSNHSRKLHQRFKEQETKDTKGQFFVVEDDIREFTQVKLDKRFQGMLHMLRHCQRLRELRGGKITRYVLL